MINILREINENDTMKDMILNVINNIEFYIEHRDKLADIHLTNDYLNHYLKSLYDALNMYENDTVPDWFKHQKPYKFLSADFPYHKPLMKWCFSFKDMVDIMLANNENIDWITCDKISINNNIITADEWRMHQHLTY